MVRNVMSVIAGYLSIAFFVFISFTLLYIVIGTEGAFQSASYQVSDMWLIFSLLLSIVAALLGGYVCILISKNQQAALVLAGIVLVVGLAMAIPVLTTPDTESIMERSGEVSSMDAMSMARQPAWITLINPVIGGIGVFLGARLKRKKD